MALVTGQIMWLAPGVIVSLVSDDVTLLVNSLIVDNPTTKPVKIIFTVHDRRSEHTVEPGLLSVVIEPPIPPQLPALGENVSITGMV